MNSDRNKRLPNLFGDDEGLLDIHCRPALPDDLHQIAFLATGLLEKIFHPAIGEIETDVIGPAVRALQSRLRHDCTWVITEGDTVIGFIDLETRETRRINGPPLAHSLAVSLDIVDKIENAGLLPLLLHEPAPDEAHQALVALLQGSRGEGRGTLLLMHGAFWARAQGKDWMTAWLPAKDQFYPVYERRGYFVEKEVVTGLEDGESWMLLKRPITTMAYREMRDRSDG